MNLSSQIDNRGLCLKGTIGFDKRSRRFYVRWYDNKIGRTIRIWFYKGIKLETRTLADKLLKLMQGDVENGVFILEKYTQNETDVVPYLKTWLESIKGNLSPATYKDYRNSIDNHIAPFFKTKLVQLHEIQYDIINELMGKIPRSGKGKLNVIYCLRACLDYAWRSKRIQAMPAFPKKKDYNIVEPVIKWLPSDRQEAVLSSIPVEHQPIFWWLKYHLRRPSEAIALLKEDFDGEVFMVQRGFSARQVHNRTKTGEIHAVPSVSDFMKWIELERAKQLRHGIISPYFFVNPRSRKTDKRYTLDFLEKTWKKACAVCGENIGLYYGTKHSTASQMVNEKHYSIDEVQLAGDWKRRESVTKYAKVEVSARKALLEGKVIKFATISPLKADKNNQ